MSKYLFYVSVLFHSFQVKIYDGIVIGVWLSQQLQLLRQNKIIKMAFYLGNSPLKKAFSGITFQSQPNTTRQPQQHSSKPTKNKIITDPPTNFKPEIHPHQQKPHHYSKQNNYLTIKQPNAEGRSQNRVKSSNQSSRMKAQSNLYNIDNRVLNITVGEIFNKKTYLASLEQELQNLKSKILCIENSQVAVNKQQHPQRNIKNREISSQQGQYRTVEARRSLCGKFYNRKGNQVADFHSSRYTNQSQEQNDRNVGFFSRSKEITNKGEVSQIKNAVSSNYRVKYQQKKKGTQSELQGRAEQKKTKQKTQQTIVYQIEKIPQHLRKVFLQKAQWQITSINDDFQDKILKKLQIPSDFPYQTPKSNFKLEQYQTISQQVYKGFGIDLSKLIQPIIIRTFKNGVYFQLKPDKNVVWYYDGNFFFGDWETQLPVEGEKNGFGFQYIPGKYCYLGNFKQGKRDGKGVIKIIDGSAQFPNLFAAYDGQWKEGKPHGYGKYVDQKNNRYIGNFQQGEKTGKAIILTYDGLYYEGDVVNGIKNGYGYQKLINGDEYKGQFVDGKFEGIGCYSWSNGSIYEGQFLKGKRHGKGKWRAHNNDQYQGDYIQDIKIGYGTYTWANGQSYEGQFVNDLRNGPGIYRHPNGKVGKFMWKDGKIQYRLYSKEEQIYRCRRAVVDE